MKGFCLHILLLLICAQSLRSQDSVQTAQPLAPPLSVAVKPDSAAVARHDSILTVVLATSDTVTRPGKSTTIAMLSSMAVPGLGQIYNGSYWKAPVIWGLSYYFWSVYRDQDKLYGKYRWLYANTLPTSPSDEDLIANYKRLRDFYHDQRDTFGWYLGITYLVNVLDAYVDASLYNFEVGPNLQGPPGSSLSLKIHF